MRGRLATLSTWTTQRQPLQQRTFRLAISWKSIGIITILYAQTTSWRWRDCSIGRTQKGRKIFPCHSPKKRPWACRSKSVWNNSRVGSRKPRCDQRRVKTTTGVHRLYELVPVVPCDQCERSPQSKLIPQYGQALCWCIRRATDTMMAGKTAMSGIWRRQALLRTSAKALRWPRLIRSGRAAMDGFEVVEDAAGSWHLYHDNSNKDVIRIEHMRAMKDMAIVETSVTLTMKSCAIKTKWTNIKDQVDMIEMPSGIASFCCVRVVWTLVTQLAHPLWCQPLQTRFADQLWTRAMNTTTIHPTKVFGRVARLYLDRIGKLTTLAKDQVDYIGVTPEGLFWARTL